MSPYGTYVEYCRRGELAYQCSVQDGRAVFYPRVLVPESGSPNLEWRVSAGRGVVYASTTVYRRNEPPRNVCLVDLDEGFRMMSRVEDIDHGAVMIGMRVRMRMHPGEGNEPPYPVFVPEDNRG